MQRLWSMMSMYFCDNEEGVRMPTRRNDHGRGSGPDRGLGDGKLTPTQHSKQERQNHPFTARWKPWASNNSRQPYIPKLGEISKVLFRFISCYSNFRLRPGTRRAVIPSCSVCNLARRECDAQSGRSPWTKLDRQCLRLRSFAGNMPVGAARFAKRGAVLLHVKCTAPRYAPGRGSLSGRWSFFIRVYTFNAIARVALAATTGPLRKQNVLGTERPYRISG
ncbi:hypothetical protein GQ53DRAFT_507450 [Thozetella sp. PMI_491]|nr:hypothetical protein GQ53DRAFT_507450 [Thozetella sp. PMI_491]